MTEEGKSEQIPSAQERTFDKLPQIPEVPQDLIPCMLEDFQEGTLKEVFINNQDWTIDHYVKDPRKKVPADDQDGEIDSYISEEKVKIIVLHPQKYFDFDTYQISVISDNERSVNKLVREQHENRPIHVCTLTKNSKGIWSVTQSLDQTPSVEQP